MNMGSGVRHTCTHTFTQLENWCSQSPEKGRRTLRSVGKEAIHTGHTQAVLVLGRTS